MRKQLQKQKENVKELYTQIPKLEKSLYKKFNVIYDSYNDGKDNEFIEKLKQEKIIEIEAEVEKVKNLVYKNPDNFYILNYSIEISTTYDKSLMQNVTYCSTRGNSYEMTVHDFEENVEPIIIKKNREQGEGEIPTYIYDFKDMLNIEEQTINEKYNPETGEKIVI